VQNVNQNQNSQNQTIQNPKTKLDKTPQMNDRDFSNDLLSTEKYMTNSYNTALNEASHEALYQDILAIFTETQNEQRQLFNLMFKNGWYKLEQEDQQKLQQKHQQFQNYTTTQFPYGGQQLQ
jgi:spore coat protein CotF